MTSSTPIPLGLVGIGAIARSQHIPTLAAQHDFALAAAASRHAAVEGIETLPDLAAMLDARPDLEAVSLAAPPGPRYAMAREAIRRGRHVMLEKPPGATLAEVHDLEALAREAGVTLFATWHSRFAPAVEPARERLAGAAIRSVEVVWKENVRHWHPGQEWIWEPGGYGVFDPGINALSILTHILPRPFRLTEATLQRPANRATPIAARCAFRDRDDLPIRMELDWRQTGPQTWDIRVETEGGPLVLSSGGAVLEAGGERLETPEAEYAGLYRRFAELIRAGRSEVDLAPMVHVADAFLRGRWEEVERFD